MESLRRVFAWMVLAGVIAATAPTVLAQTPEETLARARALYNAGRLDEAVEAAAGLRDAEPLAAEAGLVEGRARLERYRLHRDPGDLEFGRLILAGLDASRLDARGRAELLVGLAEALYLEEQFGAAAELFESLLDSTTVPDGAARERVLDWWATALDRRAQTLTPAGRESAYRRLQARMEEELRRDPACGPASYWLVVAVRALGDLERAWSAAVAGWLRAPLTRDRGAALRADLDRLVAQALVPERARALASTGGDAELIEEELQAEWEQLKARWTPGH